jgi:hypothetical protein
MKFLFVPDFCVNAAHLSVENIFNDDVREENNYRLNPDEV